MQARASAPPLTVQVGSAAFTFQSGGEVVVGRGHESDVRLDKLDSRWVSRTHLVLRFDRTHWVAIDQSRNGTYVDGTRVPRLVIRDGRAVNLGDPDEGPRLVFRLGAAARPTALPTVGDGPRFAAPLPSRHTPLDAPTVPGFPPPRDRMAPPAATPAAPEPARGPATAARNLSTRRRGARPELAPATEQPGAEPDRAAPPDRLAQPEAAPPPPGEPPQAEPPPPIAVSETPTVELTAAAADEAPQKPAEVRGRRRSLFGRRRKSFILGRSPGSDVTVDDALVSRAHAQSTPTDAGLEIEDRADENVSCVNGDPVERGLPRDGDMVTVGNADFTVSDAGPVPGAEADSEGLQVRRLGLTVDGRPVLTDVSFGAPRGTLTAVIGPPGAGKPALLDLLGAALEPTCGVVRCDGHDVHAERASAGSRIATVPQDDVMHDRLTVEQIVRYAAELRLPAGTTATERREVANRVLEELELAPLRSAKAGELSAAERRRVTVATELLTGPSLVIIDQPTALADRAPERESVMIARRLADAGRIVILATDSLGFLRLSDQVVLLTAQGRTGFVGPPGRIREAVAGTARPETVTPDEEGCVATGAHDSATPRDRTAQEAPVRRRVGLGRQTSIVARRQVRLILADRRYLLFLASLPLVFAALCLAVAGHAGLAGTDRLATGADQALEALAVLGIGAVFIGTASTVREVVFERRIVRRERAVGLSRAAYVAGKVVVFGVLSALLTAVLTTLVVLPAGAPAGGAGWPRAPVAELFLALLTTAVVSAVIGLALSALAERTRDVVPLFLLAIVVSLVFCGGVFPLTDRFGADQISWLVPARWGVAATASTVNVRAIAAPTHGDPLWTHSPRSWAFDVAMLAITGAVWTALLSCRPGRLRGRWRRRRVSGTAEADGRSLSQAG